jgi:hypothetical protein
MPTVHRAGNLRFMIYLEDHGPPHVHVFSAGAEAKVLLAPPNGRPVLEWMRGFAQVVLRAGLNRVFREVVARQAQIQRGAAGCLAADS